MCNNIAGVLSRCIKPEKGGETRTQCHKMAVQQQELSSRQSETYMSQPPKVETRLIQYQGWTNIVTVCTKTKERTRNLGL